MAHQILWEESGILVKFSGNVTQEEAQTVNDRLYSDSRYDLIKYQIGDYSDVTDLLITQFEAKVIGTLEKQSTHWCRNMVRNVVVTQNDKYIPIAMAYFKELEGTNWENRLFETLEQAYEWVNEI